MLAGYEPMPRSKESEFIVYARTHPTLRDSYPENRAKYICKAIADTIDSVLDRRRIDRAAHYSDVWLEPTIAAVIRNGQVSRFSLDENLANCLDVKSVDSADSGTANIPSAVKEVDTAIVVRYVRELNYWHLLYQLCHKLAFAEELGLSSDIPIIVSQRLYQGGGVSRVLSELPFFQNRRIIAQESNTWIRANSLYVLRPAPWKRSHFEWVTSMIPQDETGEEYEHVFCYRRENTLSERAMLDQDEIAGRFEGLGFTIIDTGGMPLASQKHLFASVKSVAGVDGAALANIMFARSGTVLGAIVPENMVYPALPCLTRTLGMDYVGACAGAVNAGSGMANRFGKPALEKFVRTFMSMVEREG